jgi:hypothetical protein
MDCFSLPAGLAFDHQARESIVRFFRRGGNYSPFKRVQESGGLNFPAIFSALALADFRVTITVVNEQAVLHHHRH